MMFDVSDDCPVDEMGLQQMQAELDVAVTVKPKARQSNKSVIIKAQVQNAKSTLEEISAHVF